MKLRTFPFENSRFSREDAMRMQQIMAECAHKWCTNANQVQYANRNIVQRAHIRSVKSLRLLDACGENTGLQISDDGRESEACIVGRIKEKIGREGHCL
jgi:hypothetical protein